MSGPNDPGLPVSEEVEQAAKLILARAHELSALPLAGLEQAARELADICGGDGLAVTRALRVAKTDMAAEPDRQNKQVIALIRRAIEIGMSNWDFENSPPL